MTGRRWGTVLDRWTPQRDGGVYMGSALRALASQGAPQRGLAELVSQLSLRCRRVT